MIRLKTLLPVAAVLLSTTMFTSAFAADGYGNDSTYTRTTSTSSSTSTAYNNGEMYYDWNPFTANEGAYFSAQAGGSFPSDDLDDSGSYALSLGYQFAPMVRAEFEAAYRNNDFDTVGGDDADTWTWMVNAFWDFKNDTRFTPYIMGGLGWAYQDADFVGFDDSDDAFVYQVGAGVSYNLNQNWALTADYRYVDTSDFDHGPGFDEDYSAHEVRGGLRYTF